MIRFIDVMKDRFAGRARLPHHTGSRGGVTEIPQVSGGQELPGIGQNAVGLVNGSDAMLSPLTARR